MMGRVRVGRGKWAKVGRDRLGEAWQGNVGRSGQREGGKGWAERGKLKVGRRKMGTRERREKLVRWREGEGGHGGAGQRASAGGSGRRLVALCRRPSPAFQSLVYG